MADVRQDRAEIFDLFNRYADALDYKRWDMLQGLFTEDVTTDWFGVHQVNGTQEVIAYISELIGKVGNTHHIFGQLQGKLRRRYGRSIGTRSRLSRRSGDKGHLFEESLAAFEAKLIRATEGWRFSHFAEPLYVMLGTQEVFGLENPAMISTKTMEKRNLERGMYSSWDICDVRVYPGGDPDLYFAEMDRQGVVAQNGHQYRQSYISLFRVSDGRISLWREYFNPIPLQEAITPMQSGQVSIQVGKRLEMKRSLKFLCCQRKWLQ